MSTLPIASRACPASRAWRQQRRIAPMVLLIGAMHRKVVVVLLIAGVCSGSGCGSNASPVRVLANGVVMVKGSPIDDGQITFESVEDGLDLGTARIAAGGKFELALKPGSYRVGVVSVAGGVSPDGLKAVDRQMIRMPLRYASPHSSGLEVQIDSAKRRVVLDLEP